MNVLDRAINFVAPRYGLRRTQARMALELTEGYLERHASRFSYDGASAGRRAYGWYAPSTDANVELMGSLVWLRNRSRDLIRNNPYASKAIEELAGNTVGTGIVPQAKTGDAALDRIIDAEWPYFVENCDTPQRLDFYGMQSLIMRTCRRERRGDPAVPAAPGEGQPARAASASDPGGRLPRSDQDDGHGQRPHHAGRRVRSARSAVGVLAVHYHPGGVLILNPRGGILSQPIPAEQVLHTYRVLRPGQVRGIPWLHPVMMALRDLDDYADAERVRKKIEACVVAMVTQPEGIDGDPLGIHGKDPLDGHPVESFQPGMTAYLKPGEDVKFNNPPVAGGYREYKMTELQGIAAGLGIPYEMLAGDLSLVNYSSWRGGQLGFRNTIEDYRWLTLIPMFCMPVRRRVIDTLVLLGKVPAKAVTDPKINLRTAVDRAAV